jgi:DNA-binding transcriptional LysR family regulator
VPKATISKSIQSLEQHLRTKLLNRTTRRVTVTPDGAAYYERVVRLIAELDELDGSMTAAQTRPTGKLRIDMSGSLAQLVVIPALPGFFAAYPDIQLDFGVSDRQTDLIGENVDCVIRAGELTDQSLIARRVAELPLVTCAAPSYLARRGVPGHPTEIARDHDLVKYLRPRTGRTLDFEFRRGAEQFHIEGRHLVALNEGNACVTAAIAGLGILQAPEFMVEHLVAHGQLVPVLSDWTATPLPLHVVYPPNRHLSNRLRVFVDWTASLFVRNRAAPGPATA